MPYVKRASHFRKDQYGKNVFVNEHMINRPNGKSNPNPDNQKADSTTRPETQPEKDPADGSSKQTPLVYYFAVQSVAEIASTYASFPNGKKQIVARLLESLKQPIITNIHPYSDIASQEYVRFMGEQLQIHHAFSTGSFTKDKFENATEEVFRMMGKQAEKTKPGNPGADIIVDNEPWSLKTQSDQGILMDRITISKFMELGKGDWKKEADLYGLRDQMFNHLERYDRIFVLRCLTPRSRNEKEYELVEIHKNILEEAKNFKCKMRHSSKQRPKPGYCKVEIDGKPAFDLYFDGGAERKLKINNLQKEFCTVHATWNFIIP